MTRTLLRWLGPIKASLFITFLAVVGSEIAYFIIGRFTGYYLLRGAIIAGVIPGTVTPPIAWYFLRLTLKLDRAEERLRIRDDRFRTILEAIHTGVLIIDPETLQIMELNQVALDMIGLPRQKIEGRQCLGLICGGVDGRCPAASRREGLESVEATLLTGDIREIPILKTVAPVVIDDRPALLESFVDITDQKRMEDDLQAANLELSLQAKKDGLTGIANRRGFDEHLEREWGRAVREKAWFSVIICDIDYFKKFNDAYGHLAGDDCLHRTAEAISGCVHRSVDLAARYGGEEFAIILPGADLKGAAEVAENIQAAVWALDIAHEHSPHGERLTLSLGVASVRPETGQKAETVINEADQALYRAKSRGRNQIVIAGLGSPDDADL